MWRNLVLSAFLLAVTGCGCSAGESPPPPVGPLLSNPAVNFKVLFPGIPVDPPLAVKVDVAFVLDDSDTMLEAKLTNETLLSGKIDERPRSAAVRVMLQRLVETLEARLAARSPGHPPVIDAAFGVARYEDFGGDFTSALRRSGSVDDPTNRDNDMDARPFILNMPILRRAHPDFEARFAAALDRTAPGDGNPYVLVPPPPGAPPVFDLRRAVDPQSGIEALYQVAARQNVDGSFGGFDADGDGSTLGSGRPTSLDPLRNPQTLPGASGDVPAVRFVADGVDADGEPRYRVADESGAVVFNGSDPVPCSGNVGGMGWRSDALHVVVLATDIATVAPLAMAPAGAQDFPAPVSLPPAPFQTLTSSDGGADAPRSPRTVLLGAFDGGVQMLGGMPVDLDPVERWEGWAGGVALTSRRTGLPGGFVAPARAHTLEETIAALNALDVEVVLLGGRNGDPIGETLALLPETMPGQHVPDSPIFVQPEFDPWFWLNGVSELTTPSIAEPSPPADENGYRGVYDMGAVWPVDRTLPEMTLAQLGTLRDTLTDALVERILAWTAAASTTGDPDSPYNVGTGPLVPLALRPVLPTVTCRLDLTVGAPVPAGDVLQIAPAGPELSNPAAGLPTYWSDQAYTATAIALRDGTELAQFKWTGRDNSISLPATAVVTYGMRATITGAFAYEDGAAPDAATEDKIVVRLASGVPSTGVEGMIAVPPQGPVPATFDVIRDAQLRLWVRNLRDAAPAIGVELLDALSGCAFVSDSTEKSPVVGVDQLHCGP